MILILVTLLLYFTGISNRKTRHTKFICRPSLRGVRLMVYSTIFEFGDVKLTLVSSVDVEKKTKKMFL